MSSREAQRGARAEIDAALLLRGTIGVNDLHVVNAVARRQRQRDAGAGAEGPSEQPVLAPIGTAGGGDENEVDRPAAAIVEAQRGGAALLRRVAGGRAIARRRGAVAG
ncbi:hypothetical protein HMPREF0731_4130, partial [Pseudoroseomonas cervicalis ATCC 49957]